MSYDLPALRIAVADGVATVTIDNPPLNLLDGTLLPSLRRFVAQVRDDEDVRVIVFDSADPDIFIAHGETRFITEPDVMAAAGAAIMAANPDAEFPAVPRRLVRRHRPRRVRRRHRRPRAHPGPRAAHR